jgi:hypothetical protein
MILSKNPVAISPKPVHTRIGASQDIGRSRFITIIFSDHDLKPAGSITNEPGTANKKNTTADAKHTTEAHIRIVPHPSIEGNFRLKDPECKIAPTIMRSTPERKTARENH